MDMEKPWLKNYPKDTPECADVAAFPSVVALFEQAVQQYAAKPAYEHLGRQLRYAELDALSKHFAAFLQNNLKLTSGDRIAIMLPNLLAYPIAFFGALRAGLVIVNVNPRSTADELIETLNRLDVETIVTFSAFAHVVEQAYAPTPLRRVIVCQLGDLLPAVKGFFVNAYIKYVRRKEPDWDIPAALRFMDVLERGQKMMFVPKYPESDSLALLQPTGGTTGTPKFAMITHANLVANVMQVSVWEKKAVTQFVERLITALPLYHTFSLMANCLLPLHLGGMSILVTDPRDMGLLIRTLKRSRFTGISGVNTLFKALLNHAAFARVDFSSLSMAIGGGMAIQDSIKQQWREVTGAPLLEGYGLTEASPVVAVDPIAGADIKGAVGLPISSTEVRILSLETREAVAVDEVGELVIKGPQVMLGYWGDDEETNNAFTGDGWFLTGDMARMDRHGYLYIVDRLKDMINVSGFNVFPQEVEDAIAQHPAVDAVGVTAVPDEQSGEAVQAFIVMRLGQDHVTDEDIITFCRKHLTAYKVPKKIRFVSTLPTSVMGKVLRRKLKDNKE